MGDPKEANNLFAWDHIKLNVPGSKEYDPRLPWVMKVRKDGNLASGVSQYIDDLRTMTCTKFGDLAANWRSDFLTWDSKTLLVNEEIEARSRVRGLEVPL